MAYSEKVIDHYENPRNVGGFDKNDPNIATGMVGAPACGDVMKLQLKVGDNGVIEDAKFKTYRGYKGDIDFDWSTTKDTMRFNYTSKMLDNDLPNN